jgi:hypothetical protein
MLIYVYYTIFSPIDDFIIYGKSLDNTPLNLPKVEITSPKNWDSIHLSSELTIKGVSSDTDNTNCTILSSINNIQPFQNASATGSQEEQDFSNWNSTFLNVTNLLRPGKNTINSLIVCLDTKNDIPTSSSHLINITGLPTTTDNQSILSSISRVIRDGLENRMVEQHKSSGAPNSGQSTTDQSVTNLQNNQHAKPIHQNNDQSQSQSQSTFSPNSGQSTTENP